MKGQKYHETALFDGLKGDFEIKKHSSFIQMHSEASLMQRKLINGIIYIVKDQLLREPNKRIFEMDLGVLKKLSGIHSTNNVYLKDALRGIRNMSIEYNILGKDKSQTWGTFSFLSFVQIDVEQRGKASIIKLECPTIVIEAIRRPRIYSKLNILITRGIDSKHALVLYELMIDYIGIGGLRISMDDLRRLFGIPDNQYRGGFRMFKDRVINKAVEEINLKTDITISLNEPERIGRKVVGLAFNVSRNLEHKRKEIGLEEVLVKLESCGFSTARAEQIIKQHDKEYIMANIAVVEEQYQKKGKIIKSVPALLTTAFKSDFRGSSARTKDRTQKKSKPKTTEVERNDLKDQFSSWKSKLLKQKLKDLSSEELEAYKIDFVSNLGEMHIASRYIEKVGFEHPIVLKTFELFMEKKLLTSEELDFQIFKSAYLENGGENGIEAG